MYIKAVLLKLSKTSNKNIPEIEKVVYLRLKIIIIILLSMIFFIINNNNNSSVLLDRSKLNVQVSKLWGLRKIMVSINST